MPEPLKELAELIAQPLGPSADWRVDYRYSVPADGGVAARRADLAVFDSRVPSFHSAAVAFVRNGHADVGTELRDIGYLGAPIALVGNEETIGAYVYSSPLVADRLGETTYSDLPQWAAEYLVPRLFEVEQLRLPIQSRDLILGETTGLLRKTISQMVSEIADEIDISPRDAFGQALSIIRSLALDSPSEWDSGLDGLVARYTDRIHLSNVPLESIGEMYESMAHALDDGIHGIFYTPAWLAQRTVSRLPTQAFLSGRAVDPACGSGTFLVAYLERWIDEHAVRKTDVIDSEALRGAVGGLDLDSIAIHSAALTLDLLVDRLSLQPVDWDLRVADATKETERAAVLVGNLPFGYRTHDRSMDVGPAILHKWLTDVEDVEHISLILPRSMTYDTASASTRSLLRSGFRVDEVILLPESTFERSSVGTIALIARRGKPTSEVLVREVTDRQLSSFRLHGTGSSFVSSFPDSLRDPWILSPFYLEFSAAEARGLGRLGDFVDARVGMQPYGQARQLIVHQEQVVGPLVLDSADHFLRGWADAPSLPTFVGDVSDLRRPGPVELFSQGKVIVRRVTNPRQRARLAARVDLEGVWFTDRFIGLWPTDLPGNVDLHAIGAYLQSGFAEVWFGSQNPSRTLRTSTLLDLPVPNMPPQWWDRVSSIGRRSDVLVNARWREVSKAQASLFQHDQVSVEEWEWLDSAVLSAFGLGEVSDGEIWDYLTERRDVGELPQ